MVCSASGLTSGSDSPWACSTCAPSPPDRAPWSSTVSSRRREGPMKRAALTLGLALLAPPAAAQWLGEPTWNAPTAGSGFTIYGDYSRPNTDAGGGNAIGGRIMLGAGTFTLTGGGAAREADPRRPRGTTLGGPAPVPLVGGKPLPGAGPPPPRRRARPGMPFP